MIWGLSLLGACSALVRIDGVVYNGEEIVDKVTRDINGQLPTELVHTAVGELEGFFGHENRFPEMDIGEHTARLILGAPIGSCKRAVYIDPTGLVLDETNDTTEFYGGEPCEEIEDVEAAFAETNKEITMDLDTRAYLRWIHEAVFEVVHRDMSVTDFAKEIFGIYWEWIDNCTKAVRLKVKDLLVKVQGNQFTNL